MRKEVYILSVAALLAACTNELEAPVGDIQQEDARIQVAMGLSSMDVTTRATVTAKSFSGREPTEENPFNPIVWFTSTQGDYSVSDAAHHNEVNFTSTGLTFPETDIYYNTADKDAYTYSIGLYPNKPGLWGIENTAGWPAEQLPEGTLLYADITGQEDLMFAKEVKGSINNKFNSTIYDTDDPNDNRLQFHHLLTWLKIRVNPAVEGAGEAWGKVMKVWVETKERVRVDLGPGTVFEKRPSDTYYVRAFDPDDASGYKDLEPAEPESPQIGNVLVVPDMSFNLKYLTESMHSASAVTEEVMIAEMKTINVQLHNLDGSEVASADDAKNKVFVITLFFHEREKVEAQCTLEPLTDELQLLYGNQVTPLTMEPVVGSYTYKGSAWVPTPAVSDGGALTAGSDFDYTYSNNIDAGTASVTALGKGTYAGRSATRTFTINPANGGGDISYAVTALNKTYGDAAFVNDLTNSLTGVVTPLTVGKDYTISYTSDNTAVAEVDASGQVTIKKALPGTPVNITATVVDGQNHTWTVAPTASYTLEVAKAAGSISYGETSVTKTYGDADFINPLTHDAPGTGQGSVSYLSSIPEVATVSSDGTISILKSGTTTITASVAEGENYTYGVGSVNYLLTVNKKQAEISFANATVDKFNNDLPFTIEVDNTGNGTVEYTANPISVAQVDSATGLVTLQGGTGQCVITATVTDSDQYTYSDMDTYDTGSHQAKVTYTIRVRAAVTP